MSTLSLNQRKLHDVQDDLESLFWVALFIIILYFPFDRQVALNIIDNVLQQHQFNQNGVPFGGDGKRSFVNSVDTSARAPNDPDRYHLAFTDTVSAPLLEWIEMYMGLIQDWIAYQDALKKWHKRQTQPAALQGGRAKADDGDESDEDDEYDEDEPVVDGVDDIGGDPKPQAPSLRDYRRLNQDWRSILKKAKKGAEGLEKKRKKAEELAEKAAAAQGAESEKREKQLEESKKIVLSEDAALPTAIKVRGGVSCGGGRLSACRARSGTWNR